MGITILDAATGSGSGGGGLLLGPETNAFTGSNRSNAESSRNTYATANADWLAEYDDNVNILITLTYSSTVVYQRRSGSSWEDVSNVVGIEGPTGPIGVTGPTGPQGNTGSTGSTGNTGAAGAAGTDGTDGIDGADGTLFSANPTGTDGQDISRFQIDGVNWNILAGTAVARAASRKITTLYEDTANYDWASPAVINRPLTLTRAPNPGTELEFVVTRSDGREFVTAHVESDDWLALTSMTAAQIAVTARNSSNADLTNMMVGIMTRLTVDEGDEGGNVSFYVGKSTTDTVLYWGMQRDDGAYRLKVREISVDGGVTEDLLTADFAAASTAGTLSTLALGVRALTEEDDALDIEVIIHLGITTDDSLNQTVSARTPCDQFRAKGFIVAGATDLPNRV